MRKVEAATLEEAYEKASKMLNCSVSELQSEVIQHPSKGILGFLKKSAIIVATCKKDKKETQSSTENKKSSTIPTPEESVASEIIATIKEEKRDDQELYFETEIEDDAIVESFFEADHEDDHDEEPIVYNELAQLIEDQLKELLSHSCFDIDVVEVDVRDNTALIFIDGEDAALLIGKDGYRYNALSYMIFNWLHAKYELFIKLEIAEFLTTQQEMIRNYIKPVIENVEKHGKGKTRFLDGILVQIALEQLRERFPDKYVAVKTGKEGKKFVVINEFNTHKSNV
ncbi:MAG TPA: Jag N-terminal domain-containing protein, partial [Sulfurovum sp.]